MVIHRLPYILYRDYPDYGYLTDNRDFGYDTASKSRLKVGDLLLSKTGSVFYSILSDTPQQIDQVITRLASLYQGVPISVIRDDAMDFYMDLQARGFVFFGEKPDASFLKSQYFSYDNIQSYELNISENQTDQIDYHKVFGDKPRLMRVQIDISSRCNENCIHCYIPANKKNGMMFKEMFDDILMQCIDMKVLNITISGGEPMLNPLLNSFLLECGQNNFSVNLLSNLTLLSEELLDILSENPLFSVQTSLYAMVEDVHDSITNRTGSFRKTMASIAKLQKRNIPLQINCPIMKQNLPYYKGVLQFASSLNVEADADYSLYGTYDLSQSNLSRRLSISEIDSIIKTGSLKSAETFRKGEQAVNNITFFDNQICPVCKSSLCISNIGEVYPCEGWQSLKLGNLKKQTLREIWLVGEMTNHLRSLTFMDFPTCNSCQNRNYCNICLILNANEDLNGNYENVNSFQCEIARLRSENSLY